MTGIGASLTWTAHAGLQYLYLAACALAEFLGGTPVDGFRLLGAVCFALSAATIADVGQRLVRDRLLVVLLVVAWATAFVMQFLTFTLEDNIVFLTPAILLLRWRAVRGERWGARESLFGGGLAPDAGCRTSSPSCFSG